MVVPFDPITYVMNPEKKTVMINDNIIRELPLLQNIIYNLYAVLSIL